MLYMNPVSIFESYLNFLIALDFWSRSQEQDHSGKVKVFSVVAPTSSTKLPGKFWLQKSLLLEVIKRQKGHSLNLSSLDEISDWILKIFSHLINKTNADISLIN